MQMEEAPADSGGFLLFPKSVLEIGLGWALGKLQL